MKNILIVHNYYQIPGGEDTVVENEKKLLEKNNHKVILYTRSNNELKNMSTLKKLLLPFITIFNPKTYKDIKSIIKKENIDIVHIHNTLNLISPAVYYAARSCKKPIVQTVHNFRFLCPNGVFFRDGHICEDCLDKGLKCAVSHNCYRGSRLQTLACVINTKIHRFTGIYKHINFICLTEFNKQKLLNLKQIKEDKIFIKPNFVKDINSFLPKGNRENYYIFVGRLEKLKGIDILLEAWKMMGDNAPELLLCGTGDMDEWCKDYIKQNELKVKQLGFVPNDKARELISKSRALILPTQWYEGFPMTIVEAFSVGTPVLCSSLGNAGSIIDEGVTGFKFKADSPAEIINAINKLENCNSIYDTTIAKYKNDYTESGNYKTLSSIYNSI